MTNELKAASATLGIFISNDRPVVSSRDIARVFEKEHRRVMQTIRELECSEDFRLHHFVPSSYTNVQNKEQPEYLITRGGFTFLAMGFTGAKAAECRSVHSSKSDCRRGLTGKILSQTKLAESRQNAPNSEHDR